MVAQGLGKEARPARKRGEEAKGEKKWRAKWQKDLFFFFW
jgi:hypothetical protein